MKSLEEVPINNYLPIPTLFKLGDVFLIMKMCTTNKQAFNYAERNPKIIEKLITKELDEADLTVRLRKFIVHKYVFHIFPKGLKMKLEFLSHILDYNKYMNEEDTQEEFERFERYNEDYILDFSEEGNEYMYKFFIFFFGTFPRINFFFEIVHDESLRDVVYLWEVQNNVESFVYGDDVMFYWKLLKADVMCFAYAIQFDNLEVYVALIEKLSPHEQHCANVLANAYFDFEEFVSNYFS